MDNYEFAGKHLSKVLDVPIGIPGEAPIIGIKDMWLPALVFVRRYPNGEIKNIATHAQLPSFDE